MLRTSGGEGSALTPTPVVAQVQVAPQAPKGYMPQQLEWLDPAKRLPLGDMGKAARAFLGSIHVCFSCCQTGHHWLICPTRPPSSPSQHSSSAPTANLISLADNDSPAAPGIFSVNPVADQLVQDGATALAGSRSLSVREEMRFEKAFEESVRRGVE
ncbi:hypothetical protein C349_04030 [Cryptococcus neoformans var. grubii Br795]|nr:hypothetical protein C349_04030 [Cryptococcus neoformans var. grubii Br795]